MAKQNKLDRVFGNRMKIVTFSLGVEVYPPYSADESIFGLPLNPEFTEFFV